MIGGWVQREPQRTFHDFLLINYFMFITYLLEVLTNTKLKPLCKGFDIPWQPAIFILFATIYGPAGQTIQRINYLH